LVLALSIPKWCEKSFHHIRLPKTELTKGREGLLRVRGHILLNLKIVKDLEI
jgi:hypothetical protein